MKRLLMRILLVAGMATSLLTLSAVSIDDWDSTDWATKVTQFNSTPVANVSGVNGVGTAAPPVVLDCVDTTADGTVDCGNNDWDTQHHAATGTGLNTWGTSTTYLGAWKSFVPTYTTSRVFLYFVTSTIPDTATVTAAVIYIYMDTENDTAHKLQAFAGTQADTLAVADFDGFGDAWSAATDTAVGWVLITLNATGIAAINKTGNTKVCLREYDHDVLDSNGDSPTHYGMYRLFDYTGTASDPYIKITYTE